MIVPGTELSVIPPKKPIVLITDASFKCSGYAFIVEDNPDQKIQSEKKTYALVPFGTEKFSPAKLKMSISPEGFSAIYMALPEFPKIVWETTRSTIFLTDNKAVTRVFQPKVISPSLFNACDYLAT